MTGCARPPRGEPGDQGLWNVAKGRQNSRRQRRRGDSRSGCVGRALAALRILRLLRVAQETMRVLPPREVWTAPILTGCLGLRSGERAAEGPAGKQGHPSGAAAEPHKRGGGPGPEPQQEGRERRSEHGHVCRVDRNVFSPRSCAGNERAGVTPWSLFLRYFCVPFKLGPTTLCLPIHTGTHLGELLEHSVCL